MSNSLFSLEYIEKLRSGEIEEEVIADYVSAPTTATTVITRTPNKDGAIIGIAGTNDNSVDFDVTLDGKSALPLGAYDMAAFPSNLREFRVWIPFNAKQKIGIKLKSNTGSAVNVAVRVRYILWG